jgi:hypothetical protein
MTDLLILGPQRHHDGPRHDAVGVGARAAARAAQPAQLLHLTADKVPHAAGPRGLHCCSCARARWREGSAGSPLCVWCFSYLMIVNYITLGFKGQIRSRILGACRKLASSSGRRALALHVVKWTTTNPQLALSPRWSRAARCSRRLGSAGGPAHTWAAGARAQPSQPWRLQRGAVTTHLQQHSRPATAIHQPPPGGSRALRPRSPIASCHKLFIALSLF